MAGGIVTEVLLKGNRPGLDGGKPKFNFMDMQTWLYFYGVLLNFGIFCLTNHDYTLEDFKQNMFGKKMETHVPTNCSWIRKTFLHQDVKWPRWHMMMSGIMATALQGMVVARYASLQGDTSPR